MNLPPELIPFLEREAGEALREAQLGAQCKVELIQHARNCIEVAGWCRVSQPDIEITDQVLEKTEGYLDGLNARVSNLEKSAMRRPYGDGKPTPTRAILPSDDPNWEWQGEPINFDPSDPAFMRAWAALQRAK